MRRDIYLQGVVPAGSKVGGLPGGGMHGKYKNPGKTERAFNVSTLEVEGGHNAVGVGTVTMV